MTDNLRNIYTNRLFIWLSTGIPTESYQKQLRIFWGQQDESFIALLYRGSGIRLIQWTNNTDDVKTKLTVAFCKYLDIAGLIGTKNISTLSSYLTDIDDCAIERPCFNGGRCIDGIHGYSCECEAGYEGTFCEISKCVISYWRMKAIKVILKTCVTVMCRGKKWNWKSVDYRLPRFIFVHHWCRAAAEN